MIIMSLTNEQKKQYRALAHSLKPVVLIAGKGFSETVMAETDRALHDHELIKIKIAIADRDHRRQLIEQICQQTGAEKVQEIGKVLVLFRATPQDRSPIRRVATPAKTPVSS